MSSDGVLDLARHDRVPTKFDHSTNTSGDLQAAGRQKTSEISSTVHPTSRRRVVLIRRQSFGGSVGSVKVTTSEKLTTNKKLTTCAVFDSLSTIVQDVDVLRINGWADRTVLCLLIE